MWVSRTSATHRSHSANRSGSDEATPALPIRWRSSGPDGGDPARASSSSTPTSRRLKAWYSTGRYAITTANSPSPVAPAATTTARGPPATSPANPRVNNDDPATYSASENESPPRSIPSTNAGLHRIRAYPSSAKDTQPTSRRKKKKGAAPARTRSRAWIVLRRTPTPLHGRPHTPKKIRLRRERPRAARGMTRVRKTSSSVHRRITTPAGSAIHRIVAAYRGEIG